MTDPNARPVPPARRATHPRVFNRPRRESAPRVAVIGGGANDEHDVSRASAAAIAGALRKHGAEVLLLVIDRHGKWHLNDEFSVSAAEAVQVLSSCDLAFPVLHGVHGEDGAVAGLLAMIGMPFVGSPVRAGALATDKWATKLIAEAVGVDTAPGVVVHPKNRHEEVAAMLASAGLAPPLVVKPTTGGSSDGVSRITTIGDLPRAITHARAYGDAVLIESFITGREVDIALWRDSSGTVRAGSTLEIGVAEDEVFDRASKYDGTAEFILPARITPTEHAAVENAARALWDALGCDGVARFDFFVTPTRVVLNEVNTSPGFTEQSQVPRMFAPVGLSYIELVAALVDSALTRTPWRS